MSYNRNVMDQRTKDGQISGELMTSQSIERRDFLDFDMLDAKIASALKRIITHLHFRKSASVEEHRAQKYDRFLRRRQITYMIHDHFRAIGVYDAAQHLLNLFSDSIRRDDIQAFETILNKAPLSSTEIPPENVLEGSYKMKIRDSVKLQTTLAMYDQENGSRSSNAKLSKIEDLGEKTH